MEIMNVYDFDSIEFTYWVINIIKENVTDLKGNIMGNYPDDKPTFPLAIVSTKEEDSDLDYKGNPLSITITCNFEMYHNAKTDVLRLQKSIEKEMIKTGFMRLSPSEPYRDTNSNKFKITEKFIIKLNLLSKQLERTSG